MPTPTEAQTRDYAVFVRVLAPNQQFCFTSVNNSLAYRDGYWHEARLVSFPAPAENELDEFGIQAGGGCTIEIADEMDDRDWPIEDENYDPILDENGDPLLTEF